MYECFSWFFPGSGSPRDHHPWRHQPHSTCPQPRKQLLSGWTVGAMMARIPQQQTGGRCGGHNGNYIGGWQWGQWQDWGWGTVRRGNDDNNAGTRAQMTTWPQNDSGSEDQDSKNRRWRSGGGWDDNDGDREGQGQGQGGGRAGRDDRNRTNAHKLVGTPRVPLPCICVGRFFCFLFYLFIHSNAPSPTQNAGEGIFILFITIALLSHLTHG